MWLGRFQIGDRVGLFALSRDRAGEVEEPFSLVQAYLYNSSGTIIEAVPMHPKNRYGGNFDFTANLRLSASYTPGHYLVLYHWSVSASPFARYDTFEVLAGGDEDGQVIAMHPIDRPEARYVIFQTESGAIKAGRNPS